ncbi:MAG: HEAT repeat domain-containing protein [Cyanobacteria bacterium P01_C01_bin.38]
MEAITVMIAGKILEFGTEKVCEKVLSGIGSKLNRSDLEKALKISVKTACEQEERLFFRCQNDGFKGTTKFLNKFFTETAIEELQKPLKNEGNLDIEFLSKAFIQEAQNHSEMQKIDESCVKPWMKVFVSTYFENTNTYIKFQVAKEDYLKQLANWFDDVKFAGISVPGQEIDKSEKLAQIFVMPDVEEDVKRKDYPVIIDEFTDISLGKRQQELFLEQRQRALINRSGNKFLASKLLTQSDSIKFVLLGAPGSGKTTLLSYFAVMLAQNKAEKLGLNSDIDYLPILIRMRDLSRLGEISILDYAKQFAEKYLLVKNLPEGFFEYWLSDGRALILLDGLDEIAEESKRYKVVQRIENFLGQFQDNTAIITSRPAGYKRDFFRTEEFPHYELLAFDDDKVEEFINRWYDSRFQDKAEAERRKESLRKALNNNERIKLLARNPLLLTIIALIHRYQAVLPKERHKLYDKAVETLITSWDANKELTTHEKLKYLELDDLRRLMEILAYWIHTQGNTGDNEGGTLIDCDELLDKLKREIKLLKGIELYKADEEAKRFIDLIQERTGLLNEQGHNCYAFVHKTFQEYLCAEEINYQADNEGDFEIILDHIRDYLHDQHWREVLLLLVAQQKPKKAARAIRKILNNGSKYEQWLHRDLLFAADCLAEDVKGLNGADGKLGEEILRGLVDLEVRKKEKVGFRVRREVFNILCRFYETAFEKQALELLKAEADKIDRVRLQNYRAELGEKEEAIVVLIKLLAEDDSGVRRSAVYALENLGKDSDTVVNALIKLLDDDDSGVRYSAANTLRKLGKDSDTIVNALIKLLADDDSRVRSSAAYALVELGKDSDTVVNTLVKLLAEDDSNVRSTAAYALIELGKDSDTVVNALVKLLAEDDSDMRLRAAYNLGNLGKDSNTVVNAIMQLLTDADSGVRLNAAYALGNLGKDSDTVINALIKLLADNRSFVRSTAADALGYLGKDSDTVVNALIKLLAENDSNVRSSAADALGNLGKDSDTVVNALIKLLTDDDSNVRLRAAYALENLGKDSDMVVNALIKMLTDGDSDVRLRATNALQNLGKDSDTVVNAIIKLLTDDDSDVRLRAVYALQKLGKDSDTVVNAFVKLLAHDDSDVRSSVAQALGNLGKDSDTVVNALVKLLADDDSDVRWRTTDALENLGKKSNKIPPLIEQWLKVNQDAEKIGDVIDALWEMVATE